MDQFAYAFLVALIAIICNIIWSIFRYFIPSSQGLRPDQSSEFIETTTSPDDTTPKMLYADIRPKQKAAALTLNQKQKKKPCREDDHIMYLSELL